MEEDIKKYADYAIAQAKAYVAQYKGHERLGGKTPEETAEINAFLETDPYSKPEVRAFVENVLKERLEGKTAAEEGKKPDVVHLAGGLGSNHLLRKMAEADETPTGKEINDALEHSVQSDFATYKAELSKQLLDGKTPEPYGKWRGLLSGVDQAVQKAAGERKLSQVVDNTWALTAAEREAGGLEYLKKQSESNNLRIYAVALTPEESRAEAKQLGMSEEEALRSARHFRETFSGLLQQSPTITLVDKEGAVLYQKKDGEVQQANGEKLAAWLASFKDEKPGESQDIKPPGKLPPPPKRGESLGR